jgi:hypothetical protein
VSLYDDMLAAAVYAPTLTGGVKPRPWNIGAQSFNGTSDVIQTPAATTLGLSNLAWGSIFAVPTIVSGTRCIMEIGGLTHGFWVGIIDGFYWFSIHRDNLNVGAIQGPAAVANVVAHLFWQITPTGIGFYVDALLAGRVNVAVVTSSATDLGGIGAIYSDSRLPSGAAIDNGSTTSTNHFAGTLADPMLGVSDQGQAGAIAMFTSIDPSQLAYRVGYQPYRTPAIAA